MKLIKTTFLALSFLAIGQLSAQTYKDVEAAASIQSAKITEGLDLTGDQMTLIFRQVLTIEDTRMRMEARGDQDAKIQEAYASQYAGFVKNVQGVLTPAQFEQKKELMADLYAPAKK